MSRYKFQEFLKKQEERFLKTEVTNSSLIRISDANHYFEMYNRELALTNNFILVKDQKPPINTELIAQDPKGGNYLTSWRGSYKIFMCQGKQQDSMDWKWKKV
jgi:hypothetical protein